ncbi:unnamed protein product [Closterium sp. Naga37s-1]|nr:unnamed protein product [Closterium sp. Naga37s-1]
MRLPLAGDAAPARARGARVLEELAGAVEVAVEAVEGVGVVVGVVAGVKSSVAAVGAEEVAAVAVGAEVAEAAEVVAAAVELVAALRRGLAPVVVSASSSSALDMAPRKQSRKGKEKVDDDDNVPSPLDHPYLVWMHQQQELGVERGLIRRDACIPFPIMPSSSSAA